MLMRVKEVSLYLVPKYYKNIPLYHGNILLKYCRRLSTILLKHCSNVATSVQTMTYVMF